MKKILLVIQREYATRVRKPSFWVLTLVVPVLVALVYAIPLMLASKSQQRAEVLVVDDSGLFAGDFRSGRHVAYHDAGGLDYAQRQLAEHDSIDAIVYIPAHETTLPTDAYLYYRTNEPSMALQANINNQLQEILRNRILQDVHGINLDDYRMLTNTHVRLHPQDVETGRGSFLEVRIIVALLLSLIIFVAVFVFGAQVMRGVMEEKSSRIVEVIVCSVKPFELMMGKVVGIGLAGLTQFALWVLLSGVAIGGLRITHADVFDSVERQHRLAQLATKGDDATAQMQAVQQATAEYEAGMGIDRDVQQLIEGLGNIDFGVVLLLFLFYFVVGYLLYAALFAAVGSLVDNDTDSQQFILPVSVPLVLSLLLMPVVVQAPSGTLSVWLSIIPFTSPVAMMCRIPFGVPVGELVLSMVLLVATFPLCTWIAARIYRSALLRYGQKTTWRTLFRWLKGSHS